jgi:ribosomal protein S18 acetylase RimI-like enzyme
MGIRPARLDDAGGIARVNVESWRSTYRGLMPDATLNGMSFERQESRWRGRLSYTTAEEIVYVADDEGIIVGYATGGRERTDDVIYKGELYAIYVLPAYVRRGVGKALARQVVQHLAECGLISMLVWVLRDNPSRGFYEALGGRELRARTIVIGGAELEEVGYVWDDISVILA